MIRARYERRGPVPQDVINAVEFETLRLNAGQALVEVVAAPINPADVLTLTGEYGQLPPLPAIEAGRLPWAGAGRGRWRLPGWAAMPATGRVLADATGRNGYPPFIENPCGLPV